MAQVVFISDAHLGSGSDTLERERQLCALLDQLFNPSVHIPNASDICPKKLFLLGDIFDFWFTYRHLVPRGHVRLLGKLAELSDAGVEIHFFTGNHDMWLFDYLERECGIVMHEEPTVFELYGKRFLIGHGDGLGNTDKGFNFIRFFFRNRFCQRLFKMLPSSITFAIAHRWSDSNKRKHERENIQHYLGDDREGIVIYCKQRLLTEHFDYCVFGHRHTPLVKEIGAETIYVNTGDWLYNRNYAVYTAEGGMEICNFEAGR